MVGHQTWSRMEPYSSPQRGDCGGPEGGGAPNLSVPSSLARPRAATGVYSRSKIASIFAAAESSAGLA